MHKASVSLPLKKVISMTIDSATMEDIQAKAKQLGIQLSSIHLNPERPLGPLPNQDLYNTHNNFSEGQDVFYDDDGLLLNFTFGSVVVVDNLPVVEAEMSQKLESEIREVFNEVGVIKEDGVSVPVNPKTQETWGHCLIEFSSRQEAELARDKRDGHKFYEHTLSVSLYDDFDSFINIPDVGSTPETDPSMCGSSWYPEPPLLSPGKEEEEEER